MAFKWDINLGHMLIAIPLVLGMTVYVVTDHNAVENLTANVDRLRADMTVQIAGIRTDIANLPDVRAQIRLQEGRISDLEANARDADKRLAKVEGSMQQPSYRTPR